MRTALAMPFIAMELMWAFLSGCSSQSTQSVTAIEDSSLAAPMVIAGDQPGEAAAAFDAAEEDLSQAQWRILEKYAPRSVWERIRENQAELADSQTPTLVNPAPPAACDSSPPATDPSVAAAPQEQPAAPLDQPTPTVPDAGRLQIYYRIRHYGGVSVKSNVADNLARRTVEIKPGESYPLEKLVADHLGDRGTVTMLPQDQALLIQCDAELEPSVLDLLQRVDVPTPQVEITARIFEVQHDMDFQTGVRILLNYLGDGDQAGLASFFSAEDFAKAVANPIAGSSPDPGAALRMIHVFGDSGWSLDATVEAMSRTGLIKLVSSPRMTVTVGNTGYVLAGQELPIQSAINANNNVVAQQITYKPVGVQLYVTPQVIGDDAVKLHVVTVASEITGFQSLPGIDGATLPTVNPIFDTREAESFVTVPDRHTLVIGGLRRLRSITRENKIPGLGDAPYLGWLFKSHRSQSQVSDLYFFITPRIIR